MIASLPMYDWLETQAANDLLWAKMATELRLSGVDAPIELARTGDLEQLWLAPDLLLAQTCSYPLENVLRGKVQYVATPTYKDEGCEKPGHYRSVILTGGAGLNLAAPADGQASLPEWLPYACLALNSDDSMSGYHALKRDADAVGRSLPKFEVKTGSHRASIIAVANGTADLCVVDCVSWAIALKYEPAAKQVHVAGWTKERPGLPLITSLEQSAATVEKLREAAKHVFNAVVLDTPTER